MTKVHVQIHSQRRRHAERKIACNASTSKKDLSPLWSLVDFSYFLSAVLSITPLTAPFVQYLLVAHVRHAGVGVAVVYEHAVEFVDQVRVESHGSRAYVDAHTSKFCAEESVVVVV